MAGDAGIDLTSRGGETGGSGAGGLRSRWPTGGGGGGACGPACGCRFISSWAEASMRRISWSALMWPADEGDEEPDDDAERDDDAEADVDADGGSGSGARRCGFWAAARAE